MKSKKLKIILLCLTIGTKLQNGFSQGTFENLNFESATLSPVPAGQFGGEVSSLDALPGWTCYIGPYQVTQVLQNNLTLGDASIDILGPDWNFNNGIIEGQYTVVLQPGDGNQGNGNFGYVSASISQTALVPANAQSLQFKAAISSPYTVSLGEQNLNLVVLGSGPNYTLYGANIPSGDTGQSEALAITALAGPNNADYFDSFVFSNQEIPEPQTWTLLLCGAGALSLWRWKRTG
jgi:hypothetical protein